MSELKFSFRKKGRSVYIMEIEGLLNRTYVGNINHIREKYIEVNDQYRENGCQRTLRGADGLNKDEIKRITGLNFQ